MIQLAVSRRAAAHISQQLRCKNHLLHRHSAAASSFSTLKTTTTPPASTSPSLVAPLGKYADPSRYLQPHPNNNITPHIASLVGRDLHLRPSHPIGIIRSKIQEYFASLSTSSGTTGDDGTTYKIFDAEDPIVTSQQCFDDLLIPPDHPGRAPSDTYYVTDTRLLRTHTSAHQSQHLRSGVDAFLCCGDVYRRDEIDATHYPAFHQMEGVKLMSTEAMASATGLTDEEWLQSPECRLIEADLKATLEGLMDHLFGPTKKRWNEDFFPFTQPSFELEIYHNDEWMEVLGCGVIHEQVLDLSNRSDRRGWAFGLGLERLAMILFKIPDIRLFWTEDERFHRQFKEGKIVEFQPYSKFPPVFKDIAFWTSDNEDTTTTTKDNFVENDFFDLVRSTAGDLVERIELIDSFTHPKTGRSSRCYRISYRSMDRNLTNEEIDDLQFKVRDETATLGCELR
jgi:phenylalanyl-tRNA synthetase alpha chain